MDPGSSPLKRRAALAPLDANAMPTMMSSPMAGNKVMLTPSALLRSSPLKDTPATAGRKRAAEEDGSPSVKKKCVDGGSTRSGSQSPDTSSLFDTSAGDASWATTTTEPDAIERIVPVTRPRALTREQAREKAEILRLRLGLASYKVRTGQTTIPLSELQRKPLPPTPRRGRFTHARIHSVDSTRVQPLPAAALHLSSQESSTDVETNGNTTSEETENGESDVERSTRGLISTAAAARMLQPSPLLQDGGGVLRAGRARAASLLGLRRVDA